MIRGLRLTVHRGLSEGMTSIEELSNRPSKCVAVVLAAGLAASVLVACGSSGEAGGDSAPASAATDSPDETETAADAGTSLPLPPPTTEPDNEAVNAALVGLSEEAAQTKAAASGYEVRIAMVDGEPRALTMDYRTDRINLELEDGVVVRAAVG